MKLTRINGFASKPTALRFPNTSRSLEPGKNRIRFWGYDKAIEITFFIELTALSKISLAADSTETGLLGAFDDALEKIHAVAQDVYERSGNPSYTCILTENDF